MSLSFAGVTFSLRWADAFDPLVERQLFVSQEHYPETNQDEVQIGGVGQGRVKLPVWLDALADLETLRSAMAAGTTGTLAGMIDGDHTSMLLMSITGIGMYSVSGTVKVKADLEFLETS